MTTLELANRALRILGEPKLSSFADNGSVSAVINDLFEQTFNLMLKEEDWYWARKRAELVEDTLLTHYSEWEYVFDLPTDLLQIRSVTNQIKEEIPYEVEQGHLFTNFPAFTDADGNNYPRMLYTAKVLDSGSVEPDLLSGYADTMTPEFEKAFAARLALEACMTVTKDRQMMQDVRGEYFLSLQRAAQLNAIAQPGFGTREYDDWSDPVEGGRMALERRLVTDFSLGQMSNRYAGRVDSEIRQKGAEEITGFVLGKDGGLRRRPGSIFVRDDLGIDPAADRLYNTSGIPAFTVYRDGVARWLAYIDDTGPSFEARQLNGVGSKSIGDGALEPGKRLSHAAPFRDPGTTYDYLFCWTDGDAFYVDLDNNTVARSTDVDLATYYQNRLIGILRSTGVINMSEVLDPLDFTDDEDENKPLSATPDFAGVETPKWIKGRQSLYVGTDAAEYEIFSAEPYFSEELGGLIIRRITDIGTEQAEYFGPAMAMRALSEIILIQYTGQSFDYQTRSITEQIDNSRLIWIATAEYGTHRYCYALDVDGKLFAYLQAPATGLSGWVVLAENVGWMSVYSKDLYVGIERGGTYSVEVFPIAGFDHPYERTEKQHAAFLANDAHGDRGGYITLSAATFTGDTLPASATMDLYKIDVANSTSTYVGEVDTTAGGVLDITLGDLKTLVGWTTGEMELYAHEADLFPVGTIRTLPLGGIIGSRSRISRVILQVEASSGARVRVNDGTWEEKITAAPESGPWAFRVEHRYDQEPRIEIQTVDSRPLNVYQIYVEVDVGGVSSLDG